MKGHNYLNITFNLVESSINLRRLEEYDVQQKNNDESLFEVIIKNQINKETTFKVFTNKGEEINLVDLYTNFTFEKNISSFIYNNSKTLELIKTIEEKNINIFDENGKIFNDICEPLSISDYDIPLKDRKELLLLKRDNICGNNCYLENIYYDDLIYKCNCKIESNFIVDEIIQNTNKTFKKIKTSQKVKDYFKYLKCSLNQKKIKLNIGFYTMLILLLIQIILLIIYMFLYTNNKNIKLKSQPT